MNQSAQTPTVLPRPSEDADLIDALAATYALAPELHASLVGALLSRASRVADSIVDASRDNLETVRGRAMEARFIAHLARDIKANHLNLQTIRKKKP